MLDVARHFFGVARGRAPDRPARALQAEPAAPAPDRRPGLAARDPLAAAAHARRRADRRRRRAGRLLHAARLPAHRRLRRRAVRRGRARDRHAGARERRARRRTASWRATGSRRPPYTGIEVGFSSLCIRKEETYAFVDDVLGEVAALTPGPVPPHRRRRAAVDRPRRLPLLRRARPADRARPRQADARLGGGRAGVDPPHDARCSTGTTRSSRARRSRRARSSSSRPRRGRTST